MKKAILFIALVAVSSIAVQVKAQVEVSIGAKGGVNLANVDINVPLFFSRAPNFSANIYPGFHGGGFLLFKLSKIGIQPEVIFSRQGSIFSLTNSPDPTIELQVNFDYINIPIICKIYLLSGLNIQVGPQVGFRVGAKAKYLDPAYMPSDEQERDITDDVKVADLGIAIGLGWDLPFGLVVDARYNFGLTDIDATSESDMENRVIQVSLGYKIFKIGGKK